MRPNPYLFFPGTCYEAMSLYADVLGGEVTFVMRNSDAARPEDRMPGGDHLVMNMAIKLDDTVLFGSDNSAEMYRAPQGFYLQIELATAAEFDRVCDALGKDAQRVDMPAGETFWAERFTMFADRFGTPWMLNYTGSKA